ncbi:MAG: phosphatase PAP2 family protein [Bacteroidia bacterium]|nr:phosphatase PAP2 family protein [Bacteroidia bacterium]
MNRREHFTSWIIFISTLCNGQAYDTLLMKDFIHQIKMMAYPIEGNLYIYPKPKIYTFIQYLPRTYQGATKLSIDKNSLKGWGVMAGSTAVLLLIDQELLDAVQQFSAHIGLDGEREYKSFVPFKFGEKNASLYDVPDNLNSAVYSVGEGLPSIFLSLGMLSYGIVKDDYRSISTASQVFQATLAMGITTQILKRLTGRESPFVATQPGGAWHPFPGLKTYQQNVPSYDAYPSGHMGTMMSTTVVIAANYPEKKWIKPVGYSIMGLVGLAMINNGVHWASDYPLAIGMGYVFGHATVKMNRFMKESWKRK